MIVKGQSKAGIAARLSSALTRPAPGVNLSSAVLDKIFGPKIWSFRAFAVSIVVASATLICVLSLNLATSDSARSSLLAAVKGQSTLGWICLAVVIGTVFIFDFVSYAQTRIFVRATEQSPSATASSVFVIADLIASFAIFIAGFALARVIAMLIVGHFLFNSPVSSVTAFAPALIEDVAVHDGIQEDVGLSALLGSDSTSAIVANSIDFNRENSIPRMEYFEGLMRVRDIGPEAAAASSYDFLTYDTSLVCPTAVDKYSFDDESAYELLTTSLYIYALGAQQVPRINKLAEDMGEEFFSRTERIMEASLSRRLATGPRDCPLPVVRIDKKVNMRDALAGVSLSDMYLSSLFYTMWEVSRAVPAKFSSYHVIDFVSDYDSFLSSSYDLSSRTAFGLNRPDEAKADLSRFLSGISPRKTEKSYVPFSSLSMTALFPSIVFILVSLARIFIWTYGVGRSGAARVFPTLNSQKFIFTVMLGSSALLLALVGIIWTALDGLWGWIWLL